MRFTRTASACARRADELVERPVGEREVLAPHRSAVAGQTFAQVEEHRLCCPRGLVAELRVSEPSSVHERRELSRGDVDVQGLKREPSLDLDGDDWCMSHFRLLTIPKGWEAEIARAQR